MSTIRRFPRILGVLALASALIFAAACDDNGDNGDGVLPDDADTPTVTGGDETDTPTSTATETETPDGGDATATPTEAAAGGGGGDAVEVSMTDFAFDMPSSLPAGDTTFQVTNDGATEHDFILIQTDMAADALPVEGATVTTDDLEVVTETRAVQAGETTEAEATLEANPYVVICNVPGHYELGMRTELTVE